MTGVYLTTKFIIIYTQPYGKSNILTREDVS